MESVSSSGPHGNSPDRSDIHIKSERQEHSGRCQLAIEFRSRRRVRTALVKTWIITWSGLLRSGLARTRGIS